MFITDQAQLEAFVDRALTSEVLAIDTEFLREKTYYPKLCLLQMQADKETVIIDPFGVTDLKAIVPLLESPTIMKVFHAGTQDIEILLRETGAMPKPVFDTQLAAALMGHTQQIGYGALVNDVCGVQLKKMDSFTDWSRRPLSSSQIKYAADDVIYLPKMYRRMSKRLSELGRINWLDDDFAALVDENRYHDDPRERFRRLKRVSQLSRRQLSAAREVAAWREKRARELDIPRKWVVTDEQIVEACKREARTIDELFMVRGVSDKLGTADARNVIAALVRGLDAPEEEWPAHDRPQKNEHNVDLEIDVMSALVRLRSREAGVAFQTLAGHSELVSLARGYRDVELLKGWRAQIVGNELLELLDGKISLSLEDGNLKVTKTSES